MGARGSVGDWGTVLQAVKTAGSIPDKVIGFFSRTMAPVSTQPL
jgi:hypothetical protein